MDPEYGWVHREALIMKIEIEEDRDKFSAQSRYYQDKNYLSHLHTKISMINI